MSDDDEKLKDAIVSAIARSLDARSLAEAVRVALPDASTPPRAPTTSAVAPAHGGKRLLTKIVLGDILDDAILSARPEDRSFPLRLLFAELGSRVASDASEGVEAAAADLAFCLASGLSFYFRAAMDGETRARVGIEVSRQLYALGATGALEAALVERAAPLLATLMSGELERLRFESVDHAKTFDGELHERGEGSDPTSSRIRRPVTFLCRVSANNGVKTKARVLT